MSRQVPEAYNSCETIFNCSSSFQIHGDGERTILLLDIDTERVGRQFLNLVRILATPRKVTFELAKNPSPGPAAAAILLISVFIGWLMVPAVEQPMRRVLESTYGEGAAESALLLVSRYFFAIELVIEPLWKVFRWLLTAGILYFLAGLMETPGKLSFKSLFALTVYGETAIVVIDTLNVALIYYRGLGQIADERDLRLVRGLDIVLSPDNQNIYLHTIFQCINPASVWYFILVGVGFSVMSGLTKSDSAMAAVTGWSGWVLSETARPWLSKLFSVWFT